MVNHLPRVFLPLGLVALVYALWLRKYRPAAYAKIASTTFRHSEARSAPVVTCARRYCVIGAGPAGLITARALLKEGVPFDCFERHSDNGGMWDSGNPGTPLYDTAHFISSKWTSYVYGYPMPDSFPDYPSGAQILAYLRGFAEAYGLRAHITFGTEMRHAAPDGDGWRVELSSGKVRQYAGVTACPGVTWRGVMPVLPRGAGVCG